MVVHWFSILQSVISERKKKRTLKNNFEYIATRQKSAYYLIILLAHFYISHRILLNKIWFQEDDKFCHLNATYKKLFKNFLKKLKNF